MPLKPVKLIEQPEFMGEIEMEESHQDKLKFVHCLSYVIEFDGGIRNISEIKSNIRQYQNTKLLITT